MSDNETGIIITLILSAAIFAVVSVSLNYQQARNRYFIDHGFTVCQIAPQVERAPSPTWTKPENCTK